jgi:hypothetical protein
MNSNCELVDEFAALVHQLLIYFFFESAAITYCTP